MNIEKRKFSVELDSADIEALAAYSSRLLWGIAPCFDLRADHAPKNWIEDNYEAVAGAVQVTAMINEIIMNALQSA